MALSSGRDSADERSARMLPPTAAIETVGTGRDLVLVHGTGADSRAFRPLMRLLSGHLRLTAYDRRGTERWPLADGAEPATAAEHAADLADLVARVASGPVHVLGLSFGATVALELARQRSDLVLGCALFEPALGEGDGAPAALLAELEHWLRRGEPERGAEAFHRRVLSGAAWERLPAEARRRARGMWRHIHADLVATTGYRVQPAELGACRVPFLLLRGGRSPSAFAAPLRVLAAALPDARSARIAQAGHVLSGAAWAELGASVRAFAGA